MGVWADGRVIILVFCGTGELLWPWCALIPPHPAYCTALSTCKLYDVLFFCILIAFGSLMLTHSVCVCQVPTAQPDLESGYEALLIKVVLVVNVSMAGEKSIWWTVIVWRLCWQVILVILHVASHWLPCVFVWMLSIGCCRRVLHWISLRILMLGLWISVRFQGHCGGQARPLNILLKLALGRSPQLWLAVNLIVRRQKHRASWGVLHVCCEVWLLVFCCLVYCLVVIHSLNLSTPLDCSCL